MTKQKVPEWAKHVTKLRESQGMNQAPFAKAIGVDQSLISKWESGDATPSFEMWIKLGAFAAQHDPPEAVVFLNNSGIDPQLLLTAAGVLLRERKVNMEPILSVAEEILKDRTEEKETAVNEGKIVLVPPYTEGEWRDQVSLPPLEVSAGQVKNLASTYYLVIGPAGYPPPGLGHWDKIAFDTFGLFPRKVGPFLNVPVLLNLGAPFIQIISPQEGGLMTGLRLRMGRLVTNTGGGTTKISFIPYGGERIDIDMFTTLPSLPRSVQEEIRKGTRYGQLGDVVDRSEKEELEARLLPPGCDILGCVVGYFPGGGDGGHEITDAQFRRYRREGQHADESS